MADNGGNIEVSNGTPPTEESTEKPTQESNKSSGNQNAEDFFREMLGGLPLPNTLEKYSSSNTIITLSALSPYEVNNPDLTYRITGSGSAIILQSGGSSGAKKVLTAYETGSKQIEYFIDNIDIATIMMVFGKLLECHYKCLAAARPLALLASYAQYVGVTDLACVANGVGSCRTVSLMVVFFVSLYYIPS